MKPIYFVILLVSLVGCKKAEIKAPVDAGCSPVCYIPCVQADGSTGVLWDADPESPEAWDSLGNDVTRPLIDSLRVCEVRRRSCELCLTNLKNAGVIQ